MHALSLVRRVFLLVPAACAACGGGGSGGSVTVTLSATPSLCGYGSAGGDYFNAGGSLFVGDLISAHGFGEEGTRGFLSFDISSVPAGATILSARLTVTQQAIGGAPYPSLGALVIDETVFGGVLDPGEYGRGYPINQGFATLSTDATIGVKSVDVTVSVADDVASARTWSQFRLRFAVESNANGGGDEAIFPAGNPSSPDDPLLVVTYR